MHIDMLIVNDDLAVAEGIAESLKRLGYTSFRISGRDEEVYQDMEKSKPILIFSDIASLERSNSLNFDAPVIYLVSNSHEETAALKRGSGPFGYLKTPVKDSELQLAMDMSLYKHVIDKKIRENEELLSATLRSIRDAVIATDIKGFITFMNASAEKLTGLTESDVVGKHVDSVLNLKNETNGEKINTSVAEVLMKGNDITLTDIILTLENGREISINSMATPRKDSSETTIGAVLVYHDVTETKRAEAQLCTLSSTVEQSPNSIMITNTEGEIEYVNPKFTEHTGYEPFEVIGKNPRIFKSGKTRPEVYRELWQTVQSGGTWRGELLNKKKNGDLSWDSVVVSPILNSEGAIINYLSIKQDISARKKAEFELKKLSEAIEKSANMVLISDKHGNIEYLNSMVEKVTGYSKEEAVSFGLKRLTFSDMAEQEYEDIISSVVSGNNWRGIYRNRKKDGTAYWSSELISPIKNDKGEVTNFLSIQEDITEKKLSEERIEYLAAYDELTGLINRNRFIKLMDEWVPLACNNLETGALLLIDIDNFKIINNTFGHSVGDEYLRSIAGLLQKNLNEYSNSNDNINEGAIIGRLGSDEFAVFMPGVTIKEALELAEYLREKVDNFHIGELPPHITTSTGIVMFPEHGKTRKELFTKVDAAIIRAKELGQNICHLYTQNDRRLEEMRSKFDWKEKILDALRDDRFEIWVQPIMNVTEKTIDQYEVLVRMRSEDGSVIAPFFFIGVAEIFGLIGAIDRVVAEKAMKLQVEMSQKGKMISLGLNLSGKDLEDDDLLEFMHQKMIETGVDPAALHFEITETEAIHDLDRAVLFIDQLKSMGCKFALDDFGAGFTSFIYLQKMSVDYLKLDGSFIKNIHKSKNDRLFVKALSDVARGMGIKTIAEFVEEKDIFDYLQKFGVDYAQGYYIGKPVPAEEIKRQATGSG